MSTTLASPPTAASSQMQTNEQRAAGFRELETEFRAAGKIHLAGLAAKRAAKFLFKPPPITCSWCGKPVTPNAARMRILASETTRASGKWLAHFHPKCGDALLDYCEARTKI